MIIPGLDPIQSKIIIDDIKLLSKDNLNDYIQNKRYQNLLDFDSTNLEYEIENFIFEYILNK